MDDALRPAGTPAFRSRLAGRRIGICAGRGHRVPTQPSRTTERRGATGEHEGSREGRKAGIAFDQRGHQPPALGETLPIRRRSASRGTPGRGEAKRAGGSSPQAHDPRAARRNLTPSDRSREAKRPPQCTNTRGPGSAGEAAPRARRYITIQDVSHERRVTRFVTCERESRRSEIADATTSESVESPAPRKGFDSRRQCL